jgi:hypothetical protein
VRGHEDQDEIASGGGNRSAPDLVEAGGVADLVVQLDEDPTLSQAQVDHSGENKEKELDPSAWLGANQGGREVVPQVSGSSNVKGVYGGERDKGHVNLAQESDAGEIAFCDRCGTYGHLVRDCRRRAVDNTQKAEVRELHVSEYITTLCAAHLDGHAFFLIPERPFEVHAKERSTMAVVTIVKGVVTARQVEEEFTRIHPKTWRWTACRVADNMFTV